MVKNPNAMRKSSISIDRKSYQKMVEHLIYLLPEEGCGLLGGRDGYISEVIPVENRLHSPVRYAMDPAMQIKGMLSLEAQNQELIGFYHSHPEGRAFPSDTDVAEATYPDELYLIIALNSDAVSEVRGFSIRDGEITEVKINIESA
ncbi:MAG: M67 family metallopeptidase [Chloroflexota bacterium]